jgi:hypothetical protein
MGKCTICIAYDFLLTGKKTLRADIDRFGYATLRAPRPRGGASQPIERNVSTMSSKNLFHSLAAIAVLVTITGAVAPPTLAQDKTPAAGTTKQTTQTAAKTYECKECNLKFTAAEAKKKGFKCACGCKLTLVKTTKKAETKKKS